MLRAISDTAVAISVASVREKPSRRASARASARAGTRSESEAISTTTSSVIDAAWVGKVIEHDDRLVEVEGCMEWGEVEVEVGHRDGDVGLDADDDRLGTA